MATYTLLNTDITLPSIITCMYCKNEKDWLPRPSSTGPSRYPVYTWVSSKGDSRKFYVCNCKNKNTELVYVRDNDAIEQALLFNHGIETPALRWE